MTRPSSAKIADKNSPLLPTSKNFSPKKALRMSRSVANPAGTFVRVTPEAVPVMVPLARCTMRFAQNAEKPVRFHSSQPLTDRLSAAIASEAAGTNKEVHPSLDAPFLKAAEAAKRLSCTINESDS
jgi:hypothetical protein